MNGALNGMLGKALAERLKGSKPGVFRALLAAIAAGSATAILTYRLLRSGD